MASFHGFRNRKSDRGTKSSHMRTASYHGSSRDDAGPSTVPADLQGLNLRNLPTTLDLNKDITAGDVTQNEPVSPHILTPHLHEIQRLKLTLLQIQNMIHSNDELILNVRQNLLRRMVNYLDSVKTKDRASAEYQTMVEIKADVEDILKEQEELIVTLRQSKLKQLVDLKPKNPDTANRPHFQQPKLNRQLSRSVEMGRVINDAGDAFELTHQSKPKPKGFPPRLKDLQRSETARAERSMFFSELAAKRGAGGGSGATAGNVVKRNKSFNVN